MPRTRRRRFARRVWLAPAAMVPLLFAGCDRCDSDDKQRNKPNIVLISVDTLRRDHIGLYGTKPSPSPHIDRFFAEKAVFERAISPTPCTEPAVEQYLTGKLGTRSKEPKRLAEYLSDLDYDTRAVVSQHLFNSEDGPVPAYSRGYRTFDLQSRESNDRHGLSTRRATEVSDGAIEWLERLAKQDRPFHLWLHYFDPHDPYDPPAGYRLPALKDLDGDRRAREAEGAASPDAPEPPDGSQPGPSFAPAEVENFRALYANEVLYLDHEVNRVLGALERLELLQDTWVVFLADHGEWLGERGLWDHCQTTHGNELFVPLLVHTDERSGRRARRYRKAVSTIDLVPTVLARLGVPQSKAGFYGRDLFTSPEDRIVHGIWFNEHTLVDASWKLNVYTGREPAPAQEVGAVATRADAAGTASGPGRQGQTRAGLTSRPSADPGPARQAYSLHDLSSDPGEDRDLSQDNPAALARLQAEAAAHLQELRAAAQENDRTVERLRSLGYLR